MPAEYWACVVADGPKAQTGGLYPFLLRLGESIGTHSEVSPFLFLGVRGHVRGACVHGGHVHIYVYVLASVCVHVCVCECVCVCVHSMVHLDYFGSSLKKKNHLFITFESTDCTYWKQLTHRPQELNISVSVSYLTSCVPH